MPFPKKVETEDMELCMKVWKLSGYDVHVFDTLPVNVEKPNIWVSDKVNHPSHAVTNADISALYTYRGDHYLALVLEGEAA